MTHSTAAHKLLRRRPPWAFFQPFIIFCFSYFNKCNPFYFNKFNRFHANVIRSPGWHISASAFYWASGYNLSHRLLHYTDRCCAPRQHRGTPLVTNAWHPNASHIGSQQIQYCKNHVLPCDIMCNPSENALLCPTAMCEELHKCTIQYCPAAQCSSDTGGHCSQRAVNSPNIPHRYTML